MPHAVVAEPPSGDAAQYSADEYTEVLAQGAGSQEWADAPDGVARKLFVASIDVPIQPWEDAVLKAVQDALAGQNADDEAWAMDESNDEGSDELLAQLQAVAQNPSHA